MRTFAVAFGWLLSVVSLGAQDRAALEAGEQQLAARAQAALHTLADALQAQQQHLRALELRREIWLEYAPDDAAARERTGFVRVGELWRKDDSKAVLDRDLKGDPRQLKKIEPQWLALQKELQTGHRALAQGFTKLGELDRAARHWQRVVRFAPGDAEAGAALALRQFEGYLGTPDELALLRRARALRTASDWLVRTTFPTTALAGEQLPLLAEANIVHQGVRSAHFTVWGTLPVADLTTLANDCERALLLARTLFGTAGGRMFVPARRRDLVFLHDVAAYAAVLDRCAAQFDAERLRFLKEDVDQAFVEHGERSLRLHKARLGLEASRDQAVRGVVQDAVGVTCDGLWEGIGHAACGFLFGRTLTFLLEQRKERTAASWTQKLLVPDLAVWQQIAEESAWAKSDTRIGELVLLSAARFTTEQRVKAWAICHWFCHTQPELVLELDRSRTKDINTPPAVETEFTRRTTRQLPQIDHQWREFWARGGPLRAAIARDPLPAEPNDAAAPPAGAAKDQRAKAAAAERQGKLLARALVDAICAQRAAAQVGPLGFHWGERAELLAVRSHDAELRKVEQLRKKKPKETFADPVPPPDFGRSVLWARDGEPLAVVAAWWQRPVWRDALLHPGRDLVSVLAGGPPWAIDLVLPAQPTRSGPPLCWPADGQTGIPAAVPAAALGPRALTALQAAGVAADAMVGTALTLHFLRPLTADQRAAVTCTAWLGDAGVPLVRVDHEPNGTEADADHDHAPGCITFVPGKPWPAGRGVEVRWGLPPGVLGKDESYPAIRFTAQ
jgi:tetratricopeptide (TPR) repeat protein